VVEDLRQSRGIDKFGTLDVLCVLVAWFHTFTRTCFPVFYVNKFHHLTMRIQTLMLLVLSLLRRTQARRSKSNSLRIQLRKEGVRSRCSRSAIRSLEIELHEAIVGEIASALGSRSLFYLGEFQTQDFKSRSDLTAQLECTGGCDSLDLKELQWVAQGAIDLFRDERDDLAKGCLGEETAAVLRLEKRLTTESY
jgi:hypothetical protein